MAPPELTWRQALAWRMRRHGLAGERAPAGDVVALAGRLCGLHAQVASSAELTAWARLDGLQRGEVQGHLTEDGGLVKTWAQRGTLHLLPVADLGVWHAAAATYAHFRRPSWLREFGFASADELERLIDAVGEVLADADAPLTREELADAVAAHTGDGSYAERLRESWGAALKPAALRGRLVFAPGTGQRVRFMAPPPVDRPPGADGVRELTRRYLAAYAPARREDLSRWWGSPALSPAQAAKRFAALGDDAVEVRVDGERAWVLAADLDAIAGADPPRAARLLPMFDQYVVGSNRGVAALLAPEHRARVFRQAGWISPVVLVDGAIAGVWSHERRGPDLVVEIEPFTKLPGWATEQVAADAKRLAGFAGGQLTLRGTS